jgi:hypothetical protein
METEYTGTEKILLSNAICQHCGERNGEHSFHGDFCPDSSRNRFSLFLPEPVVNSKGETK